MADKPWARSINVPAGGNKGLQGGENTPDAHEATGEYGFLINQGIERPLQGPKAPSACNAVPIQPRNDFRLIGALFRAGSDLRCTWQDFCNAF